MRTSTSRRGGFTLLELLMSIAIIAILASLMLAGLFRARTVADEVDARRELVALHNAVVSFCSDERFGKMGFLPSRIDPSGGDAMSQAYIKRMFPYTTGALNLPSSKLEGDQCLVFFLGGPNNSGWATDPQDPTAVYGMRIRFFEFDKKRVRDIHGDGYPSYCDRWGTPIAYFCSQRETAVWTSPSYTPDCTKIGQMFTKNPGAGLLPYPNQNVGGFQILCAGKDKLFGQQGATWTPVNAQATYPTTDPGHDDITNFASVKLGAKQQ